MLRNPAQKRRKPILAVRNLYRLLDEEKFSNIEKLNEVLWPHWSALWRACARGHYSLHRKPLREKVPSETDDEDFELAVQPALPSLKEGEYCLDLVREEGNEFSPPREAVKGSPEYTEAALITRDYEELHRHYLRASGIGSQRGKTGNEKNSLGIMSEVLPPLPRPVPDSIRHPRKALPSA
jgi:hypothetical protein